MEICERPLKLINSPHPDNIVACVFKFLAKKIKVFAVIFCMNTGKIFEDSWKPHLRAIVK